MKSNTDLAQRFTLGQHFANPFGLETWFCCPLKVAFFQKVGYVFQIFKSQKKYIPKDYPELEI